MFASGVEWSGVDGMIPCQAHTCNMHCMDSMDARIQTSRFCSPSLSPFARI